MITQETAAAIYSSYREIEVGLKLLADMEEESKNNRFDKTEPVLKDAFGRRAHLELGVPSGSNGHRILRVHPDLAKSVIRAHIEEKKCELARNQEQARIELSSKD